MWRRSRNEPTTALEEVIAGLRARLEEERDPAAISELADLLLARGMLASRADLDLDALDDYRAGADLLRMPGAQNAAVSIKTRRMLWMSLAATARLSGHLEEALDASREAAALSADLPADEIDVYGAFYSDLKKLTADLDKAEMRAECVESATAAVAWSEAMCAVDAHRFMPALGMTRATLAKALGSAGRFQEAVATAGPALDILCERDLNALRLDLLSGVGVWLRQLDRWDEAVEVERETVATVRASTPPVRWWSCTSCGCWLGAWPGPAGSRRRGRPWGRLST